MVNHQLSVFVCVADCGSFAKAGEKLFLSATAVMKQMNALEKRLEVKLVERGSHGIRLTPAGEVIYRHAKELFRASRQAIAEAKTAMNAYGNTYCVGTSMLNPCKPFMDLWYQVNDGFPGYKLHIVPFEDDHNGILNEIEALGVKYDFLVGVCDSALWLERCNFLKLGEYRRCCAVPVGHRLAGKKELALEDLHGETFMMVKKGDSPVNDRVRERIEKSHPQITIEDTANFYDIEVFNRCEQENYILSSIECWKDIHPSLVTIPAAWECGIPYGLLYSKSADADTLQIVEAIGKFTQITDGDTDASSEKRPY